MVCLQLCIQDGDTIVVMATEMQQAELMRARDKASKAKRPPPSLEEKECEGYWREYLTKGARGPSFALSTLRYPFVWRKVVLNGYSSTYLAMGLANDRAGTRYPPEH